MSNVFIEDKTNEESALGIFTSSMTVLYIRIQMQRNGK